MLFPLNYNCQSDIPQGSCLSSKLFLIFINDIPNYPHTNIATYADNTALYYAKKNPLFASNSLMHHLKILAEWFHKWKIELNFSKTTVVLFSNHAKSTKDK